MVSTAGIVTGVVGAAGSRTALLVAGVAGLLAMAVTYSGGVLLDGSTG
ncbi:hypothetical protein [Kitasatospora sp. NPDC058190]